MRKKTATIAYTIVAIACCSIVTAQDFGWRDADGKRSPDTDSRKSSSDFAGWLLTTADPDWEAKWKTPEHETPSFTEAGTVRKGETVYTLIFIVNPKPDAKGEANVSCDLKVTRPNGTTSIDEKNVECLRGVLPGSPYNMRLAAPVLGFVGEAADPAGTWRVDVTLRDVPRGLTMDLHTSFELLEGPEAKASSTR
jgi:hypothetical protein